MTLFNTETWLCPVQYSITAMADDAGEETEASATTEDSTEGTENQEQQAAATTEEAEKAPEKKPWFVERIDKLTYQKNQAESEKQTLAQQNQQLKAYVEALLTAGATPAQAATAAGAAAEGMTEAGNAGVGRAAGTPQGRLYTEAELQQMVQARATELLQQTQLSQADREFNERCNAIAAEGNAKFKDFQSAVQTLNTAGVMDRPFLEAVSQLDEAPMILHALAQDPNEAMRIKGMSSTAMAVALAKLAVKLESGAQPQVRPASNAPPPVTSVGGKGSAPPPSFDDPKLDMDAWIAMREKQVNERRH